MSQTKKCRFLPFDVVCLKDQTNHCYIACQERRDLLKKHNGVKQGKTPPLCIHCNSKMGWVDGFKESGEIRIQCSNQDCLWTTCITAPNTLSRFKHKKR